MVTGVTGRPETPAYHIGPGGDDGMGAEVFTSDPNSRTRCNMLNRAIPFSAALVAAWVAPVAAQIITIRTVPISQAHQFDILPSLRLGMGGVSIAVDDSLHDPFGNPALGARLTGSQFFGAPGLYSVSSRAGAGRTLPMGALVRSGPWFGGMSLAIQQVDFSEGSGFPIPVCPNCRMLQTDVASFPLIAPTHRSNGNTYAQGMLGRVLSNGLSIGGSVAWAGLHGIDGVDLLYAGSAGLKQSGHSLDLRLGALKQWEGNRSLSALVLHHRFATTHDVDYLDSFWDPVLQQFGQRVRSEENLDHTNTWGLHLEYRQPLRAPGWRLGWVATSNLMTHPKLPNYQIQEIQSIPRDPGNSEAFNFGVGISKSADQATLGVDVVYEPIWSYTWADAAGPVGTVSGATIPTGGKTIENHFRFSNAIIRMGVAQDLPFDRAAKVAGLQLGLVVHSINYTLAQRDNVEARSRSLQQDWIEWTPTWGLSLRFPAWEVRYRGSVTNGTGRPGVFGGDLRVDVAAPGNVLVAPIGPVTMSGVRVMTHQVSISFPFR